MRGRVSLRSVRAVLQQFRSGRPVPLTIVAVASATALLAASRQGPAQGSRGADGIQLEVTVDLQRDARSVDVTTPLEFTAAERVTSLVHVHQGGTAALSPVALFVRITDGDGKMRFSDTTVLGVQRFGTTRVADYQTDLPLTRLAPGEYVLTVQAQRGTASPEQVIRFRVARGNDSEPETAATPPTELQTLLRAVGANLDRCITDLTSVLFEERYEQRIMSEAGPSGASLSETLHSDMLVLPDDQQGWLMLRDVFDVEGYAVHARDDRLARLFATPRHDLWEARQFDVLNARFNLSTVGVPAKRTANVPLTALLFFRTPFQRRSQFTIVGQETVDGRRTTVVTFEELATPRLIALPDGAPMTGRAWIEPDSGRVLRTELKYTTSSTSGPGGDTTKATFLVKYGLDAGLGIWTPVTMDERYEVSVTGASNLEWPTLVAHATYSNYRRFNVDTARQQ